MRMPDSDRSDSQARVSVSGAFKSAQSPSTTTAGSFPHSQSRSPGDLPPASSDDAKGNGPRRPIRRLPTVAARLSQTPRYREARKALDRVRLADSTPDLLNIEESSAPTTPSGSISRRGSVATGSTSSLSSLSSSPQLPQSHHQRQQTRGSTTTINSRATESTETISSQPSVFWLQLHDARFSPYDLLVAPDVFPRPRHCEARATTPRDVSINSETGIPFVSRKLGKLGPAARNRPASDEMETRREEVVLVEVSSVGENESAGSSQVVVARAHKAERSVMEKKQLLKVSLSGRLATKFGFHAREKVMVRVVDSETVGVDYVDISYKDQLLARSDMFRIRSSMIGKCVYEGEKLPAKGSLNATVSKLIRMKPSTRAFEVVSHGYASPNSKFVFRSSSCHLYIYIQISKEMFTWDARGVLLLDKAIHGFLRDLFTKWKTPTNHSVNILLFARVYYKDQQRPGIKAMLNAACGWDAYRDFYKGVLKTRSKQEWRSISPIVSECCHAFRRHIMSKEFIAEAFKMHGKEIPEDVTRVEVELSEASDSCILEAANMALQPCYTNSAFWHIPTARAGLSLIIVTGGNGLIQTTRQWARLTTKRFLNAGIGLDLVCLSFPPLHPAPVFRFLSQFPPESGDGLEISSTKAQQLTRTPSTNLDRSKSIGNRHSELWDPLFQDDQDNAGPSIFFFYIPEWIDCSFYLKSADDDGTNPFNVGFKPRAVVCEDPREFLGALPKPLEAAVAPLGQVNPIHHDEQVFSRNIPRFETLSNSDDVPVSRTPHHSSVPERSYACDLVEVRTPVSLSSSLSSFKSEDGKAVQIATRSRQLELGESSGAFAAASRGRSPDRPVHIPRARQGLDGTPNSRPLKGRKTSGSFDSALETTLERMRYLVTSSPRRDGLSHDVAIFHHFPPWNHISVSPQTQGADNVRSSDDTPFLVSDRSIPGAQRSTCSRHEPGSAEQIPQLICSPSKWSGTLAVNARRMKPGSPDWKTAFRQYVERAGDQLTEVWQAKAQSQKGLHSQHTRSSAQSLALKHAVFSPWNPAASSPQKRSFHRRWSHVYPDRELFEAQLAEPKWYSLLHPAALPLTTDALPTIEELATLYQEYSYILDSAFHLRVPNRKVDGLGMDVRRTRDELMRRLICMRLNDGYQIVDPETPAGILAPPKKVAAQSAACTLAFDRSKTTGNLAESGLPRVVARHSQSINQILGFPVTADGDFLLIKGKNLHRITWLPQSQDVKVQRFVRNDQYFPAPQEYQYSLWICSAPTGKPDNLHCTCQFETHCTRFTFPKEAHNWNWIDHLISGYQDDDESIASMGRASALKDPLKNFKSRYILIPQSTIPDTLKNMHKEPNDSFNYEEMRITGFYKFLDSLSSLQRKPCIDDKRLESSYRVASSDPPNVRPTTMRLSSFVQAELKEDSLPASEVTSNLNSLSAPFRFFFPSPFRSDTPNGGQHDQSDGERRSAASPSASRAFRTRALPKDTPFQDIARLMEDKDLGLPIRNRRWHLRYYGKVFTGREGVDWLLKHTTVETREEAIDLGNAMLEAGYLLHAENRHRFWDGHYFYRIFSPTVEVQVPDLKVRDKAPNKKQIASANSLTSPAMSLKGEPMLQSSLAGDGSLSVGRDLGVDDGRYSITNALANRLQLSPKPCNDLSRSPSIPRDAGLDEWARQRSSTEVSSKMWKRHNDTTFKSLDSLDQGAVSPSRSPLSSTQTVEGPQIELTKDIRIALERGEKPEEATLHYTCIYNPKHCFQFRLEWNHCTPQLLEDQLDTWRKSARRYGFRLVETPLEQTDMIPPHMTGPLDRFDCSRRDNPLSPPVFIRVAVAPPTNVVTPMVRYRVNQAPETYGSITSQTLLKNREGQGQHKIQVSPINFPVELAKAFRFVLDLEPDHRFPPNAVFSFKRTGITKYTQLVHESGSAFLLIVGEDPFRGFLFVENPFLQEQAQHFSDTTGLRNLERDGPTPGPEWTGYHGQAVAATGFPERNPFIPQHRCSKSQRTDRHSQQNSCKCECPTANHLLRQIVEFCSDDTKLRLFWMNATENMMSDMNDISDHNGEPVYEEVAESLGSEIPEPKHFYKRR